MFLWEILQPTRSVTVTKRFDETFRAFRKQYPSLDATLEAFVAFRCSHRSDEPYATKDSPFSVHNELRGYRHYHMIHGRIILIYKVTQSELQLCLVTDHSYSTAAGSNRLINYLHSPSTAYAPVTPPQPTHVLTSAQKRDVHELLFQYAAEDRQGLERAVTGDMADLLEYIRLVIEVPWTDEIKDAAVFAAFDGQPGLRAAAKRVLQQTTVRA